uniref:PX domain-containing protein n=1 Tax=Globisporangium ultimum (strain ATCC 200006 / CBS 805.95 / DAOM BR144) TaxID=431595 RepID=K3XBN0_GLOUD
MANEANVAPEHQDKFQTYPALPALPKTSLFKGRSNKKQTEEREAQFLKILNAIARHPIAVESPKFKTFLA